jgi:hypothetical protein
MEYTKPQIVMSGNAIDAIQGQKDLGEADNVPHQQKPSIAAYEADE